MIGPLAASEGECVSVAEVPAAISHLKTYVRPIDRSVTEAQKNRAKLRIECPEKFRNIRFSALDRFSKSSDAREIGARVIDRGPVLITSNRSKMRVQAEIDVRWVTRRKLDKPARLKEGACAMSGTRGPCRWLSD
jgi:hypothetical protein